jgi:predicted dehydrogenase
MLPVGVIGAGNEWEATWRPALSSQSRLQVAAFHDPIAVRGAAAARDVDARFYSGARELFAGAGPLRALLVLDAGWLGSWVIREAAKNRIPLFVAPAAIDVREVASLNDEEFCDLLFQPDLRSRYTPATMRLRELVATQLGPIEFLSIDVDLRSGDRIWSVAQLIDWCRFVVQSAIVNAKIEWKEHASGPSQVLQLTFRKTRGDQPVTAEIQLSSSSSAPTGPGSPSVFHAEIACASGTASIHGIRQIHWRTTDSSLSEKLQDDRSSSHVQLDLFGRRLVGGLVPAANLHDLRSAVQLAQQTLDSIEN